MRRLTLGLVLAAALGAAFWALFLRGDEGDMTGTAARFAEAAAAQDITAAHAEFSAVLQTRMPAAQLELGLAELGIWGQPGEFAFHTQTLAGDTAQLEGHWQGRAGQQVPVSLGLVKEQGRWRITTISLGGD